MPSYKAIAEYYDAEYADKAMLREDVPLFLDHLPTTRRRSVLELCVGTARAAIPIAQAGHRVVGVDYDPDLLAIARRKRDAVGLTDRHLALRLGNALTIDLPDRFDWVAIFFNTLLAFPTLAELDRLLGVVRHHLKPAGRFWVDVFNPDPHLLAVPRSAGLDPHVFRVPALDRTVVSTTDIRRNAAEQTQQVTFHYEWFDAAGRRRRERNRFTMTWLYPRELRLLLERNGLAIEHLYGNYDGTAVTDASPRLIACCKPAP